MIRKEVDPSTADGATMNDEREPETPLDYAEAALGRPDLTFRVSPKRFRTKLLLGAALVAYGVIANMVAWQFGFWRTDHITLLVLFAPPLTGVSILRKLFAARGSSILVYPHGLLRVQRNDAIAMPWNDLSRMQLNAEQVGWTIDRDGAGHVVGVNIFVTAPSIRLDKASLTLTRIDDTEIVLNATLERYPELVQEIFQRSFPTLFAGLWDDLNAEPDDGSVPSRFFGPWSATLNGLWMDNREVPWADLTGFVVRNKVLFVSFLRKGKDETAVAALESIPNFHLLVALHAALQPASSSPPA